MRKISTAVSMIFIFIFITVSCLSTAVFAASQSDLSENRQSQKEQEELLNKVKKDKETALNAKKQIDNEVDQISGEISDINSEIASYDQVIAQKQQELDEAMASTTEQNDLLKKRLRVMYEDGLTSYLEILFSAESFSDFISKYNMIGDILEYDNKILEEKKVAEQEIEEKKIALETEKGKQENAKQALESKQSLLTAKQKQQEEFVNELESDEQEAKKVMAQLEAEEANILNQIAAQQRQAAQSQQQNNSGSGNASGGAVAATGGYIWPCHGTVTCEFGPRIHPITKVYSNHSGMDIGVPKGTKIVAIADGVVTTAGWNNVYGNYVIINHGNGLSSLYGHNTSLNVSVGQTVKQGQQIAAAGSTGWSTGNHCHLSVIKNGTYVNPRNYIG